MGDMDEIGGDKVYGLEQICKLKLMGRTVDGEPEVVIGTVEG